MKSIIAKILTVLILVSIFVCSVSCSFETSTAQGTNDSKDTTKTNASYDDETTEKTNTEETNTEETTQPQNDEKDPIVFEEMIAVENEECVIKITQIDPENMWGVTLKLQLENKSADKTYMFSVQSAAINGVQCDPFFASEVTAGKKANEEIRFSNSKLEENKIEKCTDIELTFRVYDSNDWSAGEVAIETIHVYPYGEDKASQFVRESQPSDNVIVDNEYVTVIVTGYENDSIWGYTVNLFLLNKTDKTVMFSVDDASVNGYMIDPFYAKSVLAGKCAFSSMSWSDSKLEKNGITEVEEIEFRIRAHNNDNWQDDDFENKVITLKP